MKRLIILKVEYLDLKGKKVLKAQEQELRAKLCRDSIVQFKKEMKDWITDKSIRITKEYTIFEEEKTSPSLIIEFQEERWELLYKKLISLSITDVIDTFLPKDT